MTVTFSREVLKKSYVFNVMSRLWEFQRGTKGQLKGTLPEQRRQGVKYRVVQKESRQFKFGPILHCLGPECSQTNCLSARYRNIFTPLSDFSRIFLLSSVVPDVSVRISEYYTPRRQILGQYAVIRAAVLTNIHRQMREKTE